MPRSLVRPTIAVPLVLVIACALFAIGLSRPAHAANASVSIANFSFTPSTVSVNVGETVTWTNNQDGVTHTVSSDSAGVFDSGNLASGSSFQKTFTTAGTFTYHCNIHSTMTGTVIVSDQTGATATPTATSTSSTPSPTATATSTAGTATATPTVATATPTLSPTTVPATATPTRTASPTAQATAAAATSVVPLPPNTGDSSSGSSGDSTMGWLFAAIALLLVASGGGIAVARRR
ncbi:MAG: plastocyanin/azurin family copper-binding protein [bacterium]